MDAGEKETRHVDFNTLVLQSIGDFPQGGGYAAAPADVERVANHAVVWDNAKNRLCIYPKKATPTFCSAAVYMALLRSLQRLEHATQSPLPVEAWKAMDVRPQQADGTGVWGRANANGPGLAKLVHDLQAGINFQDIRAARPGDFLKFFWSNEIGRHERGHLVIFLGTEKRKDGIYLRYWSANKPGGYGIKTAPLSRLHNLIFTRITTPQNVARAATLPQHDSWLQSMQLRSWSLQAVKKACNIR